MSFNLNACEACAALCSDFNNDFPPPDSGMFNPINQYEQAYMYYRYMCMFMDYKMDLEHSYSNKAHELVSNNKEDEFIEYASIIGDYETVIMYYINQGNISEALDKLITFASFALITLSPLTSPVE